MKIISINDNWEFGRTMYAGKKRGMLGDSMFDEAIVWHPGSVPGNVQIDLNALGIMDDPYFADNADYYRWCEEVDFWYRTKLQPLKIESTQRVILNFAGLDCFSTIWLNGKKIGEHENMFIP